MQPPFWMQKSRGLRIPWAWGWKKVKIHTILQKVEGNSSSNQNQWHLKSCWNSTTMIGCDCFLHVVIRVYWDQIKEFNSNCHDLITISMTYTQNKENSGIAYSLTKETWSMELHSNSMRDVKKEQVQGHTPIAKCPRLVFHSCPTQNNQSYLSRHFLTTQTCCGAFTKTQEGWTMNQVNNLVQTHIFMHPRTQKKHHEVRQEHNDRIEHLLNHRDCLTSTWLTMTFSNTGTVFHSLSVQELLTEYKFSQWASIPALHACFSP